MKLSKRRIVKSAKRQQGMTLLVGLILLVMLTVISTIGFRNTTMSERMTGNTVDRNVSFQSAESAGKEALQVIESGNFSAGTPGHYGLPIPQGGTTTYWTQGKGAASVAQVDCATTTPFSWQSCSAQVTTKYTNNYHKAQYVIELLTESPPIAGAKTRTYRITSRSTGGSDLADVVLQTFYVRTSTP